MTDAEPALPPRPPLDLAALAVAPWPVEVVPQAGSTNAVLLERARAGAEPQVLVTEHQTAGRGRMTRTWETPDRAALTLSVLLRPRAVPERWPWLPLLTGYAVSRVLPSLDPPVTLKWPNDVLAGERKLAGILVERVEGPSGPAAVIGIGLNVTTTYGELPVPTATSLLLAGAGGPGLDRTALLLALLAELARVLDLWAEGGAQDGSLRASYAQQCSTVGRTVRVELPGGRTLTGRAVEVDAHGRLVVETAAGREAVAAGDVVHVRADGTVT